MLDTSLSVNHEIIINAPTTEVWDALVNPDKIKEYFYGTETIADWQKGGKIIFRGNFDGKSYEDKGFVVQIDPPRLLEYKYWSAWSGLEDKPENYQSVSFKLLPDNDATQLIMTQSGFADTDKQNHAEQMWPEVLINIKKVVEGN